MVEKFRRTVLERIDWLDLLTVLLLVLLIIRGGFP